MDLLHRVERRRKRARLPSDGHASPRRRDALPCDALPLAFGIFKTILFSQSVGHAPPLFRDITSERCSMLVNGGDIFIRWEGVVI